MEALDAGVRERIVAAYARPTRITRTKDVGADWKVTPPPNRTNYRCLFEARTG